MSSRSRLYLYIAAGAYLADNGFGLVRDALAERPDNSALYMVFGVAFVIIGGFLAVKSIRDISKGNDDDNAEGE